ncbi:MAG: hypothetical protein GW748_04075 [Alphaproteobacteria bacterium]|nr:hypothetical protein [Alphaproteobacteria bacterium]NCQ66900.1 hypothetical protein [Alphaproteobacteria bacterium]NCT07468.1 hypothetical protein [Alphaproteobacteria bacterium]
MIKVRSNLNLFAFLALLIGSNPQAEASGHLLEEFQILSTKNFSGSLNIGLYFQKPTTLKITLEGNPVEKHDGNLPFFSSTFNADDAILTDLFGAFMVQVTRGEQTHIIEAILQEKATQGLISSDIEGKDTGKIAIDTSDIINFVLKTDFKFERLYALGDRQGTVKITLQNKPDEKPNPHWMAYPHPFFEAKEVGLQVLRTLFQKAYEVDSKEKVSHYFL